MDRAERLDAILADWCDRRDRGDAASAEDVIAEHPDLAKELREIFESMRFIDLALAGEPEQRPGTPRRIGEFRILREVGRGGMGVVYEAEQASMGRRVALKVLSPAVTGIGEAVERFQREARAAGRLHHTNIVPVYGMGEDRGLWFYAMEMVEGRSLGEAIQEKRESARAVAESSGRKRTVGSTSRGHEDFVRLAQAVAGVADALHTAHLEGIVHRDVKPSNLLLTPDGNLRLVDFGLAHLEGVDAHMTRTGQLLGTPHYMSPEQAMAKRMSIDERTDIYSLGATLYEALTLELPFRGDNLQEVCSQIVTKDPKAPRQIDPRIPRDLETIVSKAMEKDRDRRYQTADEMARDLRRFVEGMPVRARRIGPVGRAWRRVKRNKVRAALIAAVVGLVAVGGILALRMGREARERRGLEYAALCARAGVAAPRSADLAALSEIEERRAPGETSRDLYAAAIAVDPERHEAWFGRALAPGRTLEQRLADLDEAESRGLAERIGRLARAYVSRAEGAREAADEAGLLDDLDAETPEEALFLARLLAGENRREEARKLLTRAVDAAPQGSVVQYLALRYRASLWSKDGYFEEALADRHVLRSPAVGDESVELAIEVACVWRRMGNERQAEAEFIAAIDWVRRTVDPRQWQRLCAKCRAVGERDWSRRATQAAVAAFPDESDILLERALVDVENRLELCNRAIELDPENAVAWRILSRRLKGLDRTDDSMAAIQRACELDPESAQIRCMLGLRYMGYERYEDAAAAFREAIARDPRFGDAHKYLGASLEKLGRDEEALEAYAQAIDVQPISPMFRHRRWRLLRRVGRWEQAREEIEHAAASNHAGPGGHHIRAYALAELGRFDEALEDVEEAIRTHPRVYFLLGMRAGFLSDLGRHEESLAQYAEVIDAMRPSSYTRYGRGIVLLELGRDEEALADMEEARRLGHQNPLYPHAMRAFCLARLDRFDEASEGLDLPDELCPYAEYVLEWQARTLILMGRYEDALLRATTLTAWYPEHPCYLVRCLLAVGRTAEAVDAAGHCLERGVEPNRDLCTAWLHAVMGDAHAARGILERHGDPASPTSCYQRASVHARLGDADSAVEWLTRAVESGFRRPSSAPPDPDFETVADDPRYRSLWERLTARRDG